MVRVYVLPLADDGSPILSGDGKFLKLPEPTEPYILRFLVYAWSPFRSNGSLWSNHPPRGEAFERGKFYEYTMASTPGHSLAADTHIDIEIRQSGSFSFYLTYGEELDTPWEAQKEPTPGSRRASIVAQRHATDHPHPHGDDDADDAAHAVEGMRLRPRRRSSVTDLQLEQRKSETFYFIVETSFRLNGNAVPASSLAVQTVLSKLMGPFDTWEPKLKAIADKGYNMIHFVPLQKRGHSDSPFSIYDQLAWDDACFPNGEDDVAKLVHDLESKHRILSLSDIVLNHTADNSQWLREHPEVGYSPETAPHLRAALDLDDALIDFSARLGEFGLPTNLNSEDDLDRIVGALKERVFGVVRLWEYYVVDVQTAVSEAEQAAASVEPAHIDDDAVRSNLKSLAILASSTAGIGFADEEFGVGRYSRSLDPAKFAAIVKAADLGKSFTDTAKALVDEINVPLYVEYDADIVTITDNLRSRARYTRLDQNGPRLGAISAKLPFSETYFTRFTDTSGTKRALVNNGWVWAGNPLIDFASNKSRAYVRREVIIWGDCVKLRYGDGPDSCPYLWDRMKRYAQLLATHFHGLRIDNAHSTPIHVAEWILDQARLIRPNLFVVAELFTGSEAMDKVFIERLAITAIIREAMQAWSVQELSTLVQKNSGRPIGSFSRAPVLRHGWLKAHSKGEEIHLIRTSPIQAWFLDCSHDNETPAIKRTVEDTLPTAALVSICSCPTGSTIGFDECYEEPLNVVTETRPYVFGNGITKIKAFLNKMHKSLGELDSDESFTHLEGQYITVQRLDPVTGKGYFLIARTKFSPEGHQDCMSRFPFSFLLGFNCEAIAPGKINSTNKQYHQLSWKVRRPNASLPSRSCARATLSAMRTKSNPSRSSSRSSKSRRSTLTRRLVRRRSGRPATFPRARSPSLRQHTSRPTKSSLTVCCRRPRRPSTA